MDKVTGQCPQTISFLKRKESRSGIEPRSFRLPAQCLTARPNRLTPNNYDDDDCFYIALFSTLEQTHNILPCGRMIEHIPVFVSLSLLRLHVVQLQHFKDSDTLRVCWVILLRVRACDAISVLHART